MKLATTFAAIATGITFAFGAGAAFAQNAAPTENKGVSVSQPTALDLTNEVDSVAGRQLRMRTVTLAPGGVVAVHSHKGRPAVATVVQGTLTEHRDNGEVVDRHQGDSWTEGDGVTHWAENKGDIAVIVIAVDVFKP